MLPEGHRWFTSWLPLAKEAGPFLTVCLAAILVITTWWLVSKIDDCVERNRMLSDTLVAKQESMYQHILLRLANCQPTRP